MNYLLNLEELSALLSITPIEALEIREISEFVFEVKFCGSSADK
jgi:hypothetical protein